jgi:ubiquinone/menaquinone biosynthesis C-methylase UbiE
MTTNDKNYDDAIKANIAVHSAMANDYNTIEPHFRPESIQRVNGIIDQISKEITIKNALDLGCGTGFMINILKKHASNITGIDVTQPMLDKVDLSGNAKINLINGDTGETTLPENYFDIATAYTFLDHLYDMMPTFKNCFKSLKKGGLFYADLSPNAYFWDEIKKISATNNNFDPIINREIHAVTKKDEEIEQQFGVNKEIFIQAEFQKHVEGGLREEKVKEQLLQTGFTEVKFIYHWFIGQAQMINDETIDKKERFAHAEVMHNYLIKSMPLSRHLFKYVGFIAKK